MTTQAGLTASRQRYIVLPGVKGHLAWSVWDSALATPKAEYSSRADAIALAQMLNTTKAYGNPAAQP